MTDATEFPIPEPGAEWLSAPPEPSPRFFPVYARVSLALQRAMRVAIPSLLLGEAVPDEDVNNMIPILAYSCGAPFRGRSKTELTYDVMNPAALQNFLRTARSGLTARMTATHRALLEAGKPDAARAYAAENARTAFIRCRRNGGMQKRLYSLLFAESALLYELIALGGLGELSIREQGTRRRHFVKRWTYLLTRLFPGVDCAKAAPALLQAATVALVEALADLERAQAEG